MAEHLRISLIDPRWKLQRDSMLAKIRETTKASDDEISRNLIGLAKSRPDVFGASLSLESTPTRMCAPQDVSTITIINGKR